MEYAELAGKGEHHAIDATTDLIVVETHCDLSVPVASEGPAS